MRRLLCLVLLLAAGPAAAQTFTVSSATPAALSAAITSANAYSGAATVVLAPGSAAAARSPQSPGPASGPGCSWPGRPPTPCRPAAP